MGDPERLGELELITVVMLENIAERLQAVDGLWRLELEFRNGSLQSIWRHQQVTKEKLHSFDNAPASPR